MPGPQPPEALLDRIVPGADLIVPLANGEPTGLIDALEQHADRLARVRIHQMHPLRERAYIRGAFGDRLRHVSYFLSAADRQAYLDGHCDLVPNHFFEMPQLLHQTTRCSMVLAAASPPDRHGFFSLGTNADYAAALIGRVPFWLEVNEQMPATTGHNVIHVSQIEGWSHADRPLMEFQPAIPSEADQRIAELIAERIPDGATLQTGIGAIPNAVMDALRDHRDLGLHTEMLSDGAIDLIESGVINGTRKFRRRNKHVATFCLGTKRLYDFLRDNDGVEMLSVDWVNNPVTIAQQPDFAAINATTEVDLFGQCASETIAGRYWSSSGGQADFARGAMAAERGQAFIVLHATARSGRSRIRAQLTPGSVVTTSKNTVDHVVTEHGAVRLRGKSLGERARLLISIAAPEHRDDLEREGRELGLVHG
ncbi:MAG: propionyl-CoA--succinate CoA transferase [Actinobacteria bacterium]|nr:propionyl-CoA--succinate CoA transferase [Actinomycetota bacterium]